MTDVKNVDDIAGNREQDAVLILFCAIEQLAQLEGKFVTFERLGAA
jgi:hypothetical protein